MAYEIKDPFLQCVYQWQTLITGFFALIAALGTIWSTRKAAKHQVKAALEQTGVAQKQINIMLDMEKRRVVRESHAFLATLKAAMGTVLEDIKAAREICPDPMATTGTVGNAYAARKRIRKMAFADIRSACLCVSSELTARFLQLEHEIDNYSAQCFETPTQQGVKEGLLEQLECIEKHAASLCDEAIKRMRCCEEVLREPEDQKNGSANIDTAT